LDAFAASWSHDEANSIAPLHGELTTAGPPSSTAPASPAPAHARPPRKSQRVPIELGAGLRQRGATGVSVQIMDLSVNGFRAATHLELSSGVDVWLRLPRLEPCHAKVVWTEGLLVGCEFERPLHPAVLDMIVKDALSR
jgi:hypothetical protein